MRRARDNPFSSDRVLKIRYQPVGWTWKELMARLERMRYRGAIVGPEGRGKTTLLEDLEPHLAALGYAVSLRRIVSDSPALPDEELRRMERLADRDILLLEGGELLSRWRWRKVLRATERAGGVIVTAHRPGLLPTLVECESHADLVDEIVQRLSGDSEFPQPVVHELLMKHKGNVRDVLRDLYDRWSSVRED